MKIKNLISHLNHKMNTKNKGILLLALAVIYIIRMSFGYVDSEGYAMIVFDLIILTTVYTLLENLIFTVLFRAEIPIIQHNFINLIICNLGAYYMFKFFYKSSDFQYLVTIIIICIQSLSLLFIIKEKVIKKIIIIVLKMFFTIVVTFLLFALWVCTFVPLT